MKRVVILGASLASRRIIKTLREKAFEGIISLLVYDDFLPKSRYDFDSLAMSRVPKDNFYEEHNVEVFFNCQITRLNLNRRKIYFEDKVQEDKKTQLDFDYLVIGETPENRFEDIKGINKKGVLGLRKIEDLYRAFESSHFVDTITICSDHLYGFLLACRLVKGKSDVVLIQSSEGFLSSIFNKEERAFLLKELEVRKVKIELSATVEEILGDGDLRAVKTNRAKAYGCELVLFDTNEDLRLFQSSELKMDKAVMTDDFFKTSVENVFAVDSVAQVPVKQLNYKKQLLSDDYLIYQGQMVAEQIVAKESNAEFVGDCFMHDENVLSFCSEPSADFSMIFLGDVQKGFKDIIVREFVPLEMVLMKIFGFDNIPVGGVLINKQKDLDKFLQVIQNKDNLLLEI